MEEDIKTLEELLKASKENDMYEGNKYFKSLEYFIKEYQDLKEIEENHRKENGELREQVKELEEDLTSVYLKGIYDERDKRIALVKEKIEELDRKITYIESQYTNGGQNCNSNYLSALYQKQVLQELLEERNK